MVAKGCVEGLKLRQFANPVDGVGDEQRRLNCATRDVWNDLRADSSLIFESTSPFAVYPVSQRITSSTSAFVRFFFSALATYIG